MFAAAPLLRTATVAATSAASPTSHIPHLTVHILQRRTRPIISRPLHRSATVQQQRRQSTSASIDDFASVDPQSDFPHIKDARTAVKASSAHERNASLIGGTSQTQIASGAEDINFYTVLEHQSPDLAALAFFDHVIGEPFIRNASDELFDKALLLLDPFHLIEPYTKVYRHLKNWNEETFLQHGLRNINERLDNYRHLFERILTLRHEGQNKFTLNACKHILKWAGSLGNQSLALRVFRDVMKKDEIKPDLDCYNYLMQAMNWSKGYDAESKFAYRALPRHREIRASKMRPDKLSGFRTASSAKGSVGIRAQTLNCFKELCEEGHTANEMTFINLMTAMGRESDIKGVVSILKSVWNIDLGMLEKFDEDEVESPTFYEEGTPLRPSENLLFTIAHIFGSNNDARTAWLLVDYISRNYALKIPQHVWTELLEWYMVLSIKRSKVEKTQGSAKGMIKLDAFAQLVQVMSDEPHNIKPNVVAHYLHSRVRRDQRNLDNQIQTIRDLQSAFTEQMNHMRPTMATLTHLIRQIPRRDLHHLWNNTEFLRARQDFNVASLEVESCRAMMQHAAYQYLIRCRYWSGGRKMTHWERRSLPQLVEEFAEYLPQSFSYTSTTGTIILRDPKWKRGGSREPNASTYRTMVKFRQLLDTEDHDVLLQGVLQLKKLIATTVHKQNQ